MYVVDIFPSFGSFNFWPLNVPQRPDLATGTAGITDNRNKNNPEKYGHKKRQQCFYKTSFLTSFFLSISMGLPKFSMHSQGCIFASQTVLNVKIPEEQINFRTRWF